MKELRVTPNEKTPAIIEWEDLCALHQMWQNVARSYRI